MRVHLHKSTAVMLVMTLVFYVLLLGCKERISPISTDIAIVESRMYQIHAAILKYTHEKGISALRDESQIAVQLTKPAQYNQCFEQPGWKAAGPNVLLDPHGRKYELSFVDHSTIAIAHKNSKESVDLRESLDEFWHRDRK